MPLVVLKIRNIFEIDKFSSTDPTTAKLAVGALIGAGMFVVCVVAGGVMFMMPFTPPNWPLTRTGLSERSERSLLYRKKSANGPLNPIEEILFAISGHYIGWCTVYIKVE